MKTFVVCVSILMVMTANAQSLGLRLGHSLTPADHLSLRYEHWTNGSVNPTAAFFYERSRANCLNYSCYGIDVLGEYVANRASLSDNLFGWRAGIGATILNENEPWLYKTSTFVQRLNYGLACEGAIECYLSEVFRLSLFAQQKLFFRSSLGSTQFLFGLGLTYNLSAN
ncbi:MAG: conjugal transfer protein TraO [Bacteroidota bacterium]